MSVPEPASSPHRAASHHPYAIAHRAGNNLHALEGALAVGADAIECDLWHYHGKLSLRHERKLPALPILYDRWYIRWSWGVLGLRDLLRAINRRTELFLDIKSRTSRAADAVLELYRDNESMMPETRVSSHEWSLLDRLGRSGTRMQMFYSVKNGSGLDALRRRIPEPYPPAGTSIRHTLLSPAIIDELHDGGIEVYAWTVNNPHRAEELVGWGVDGIIADNLDVLRVARA
ncbi:MAG TPA: glycerophosphodiester phosphodiesterase [Dehalococcoidia bacterium]